MRRSLAVSAAVVAVALAGSTVAPALAGPSPSDMKSKRITVTVKDRAGDVKAVKGTLTYQDGQLNEGPSSPTPTTAADRAIDLRKVTYTVVRTGSSPALHIVYTVKGPFSISDSGSSISFDGVETSVGHGYSVVAVNDKHVAGFLPTGLIDKKGHKHACSGLTQKQPTKRIAEQIVPLSCLKKVGIRSSALSTTTLHGTAKQTSDSSGQYTIATDGSSSTRMLPLTVYKKK